MSSFSCSYLDERSGKCLRLEKDCVPGRNGCVLKNKCEFIIPASERVKGMDKTQEKLKDDYNSENKQGGKSG